MNKAKIGFDRMANIIQNDKKLATNEAINEVLKADIINILKHYFNLIDSTAEVEIDVLSQNDMNIYFAVKATRMKEFFMA